MTFKELNLSAPLLRAVQEAGYETPSPIQAAAIPPVLAGRDLMGCAQTGTGKTAAFALPMLDRLTANAPRRKGAVRALILTPTRELALQIGESFEAYGKYLKLRSTVIFGGVGQAPQVEALKKGVDILIACPGRLNDLIGQGFIDLSALEIFVLDEADRMLDMGFVHDVKKVIAKLPAQRQNLMFSATMPASCTTPPLSRWTRCPAPWTASNRACTMWKRATRSSCCRGSSKICSRRWSMRWCSAAPSTARIRSQRT